MSESERKDLDEWLKERADRLVAKEEIENKEFDDLEKQHGDNFYKVEEEMGMKKYYKSRMACRADCGEKNPTLVCPECKVTREHLIFSISGTKIAKIVDNLEGYCSEKCQKDDWKVRNYQFYHL